MPYMQRDPSIDAVLLGTDEIPRLKLGPTRRRVDTSRGETPGRRQDFKRWMAKRTTGMEQNRRSEV
jgi:hypothetical protein